MAVTMESPFKMRPRIFIRGLARPLVRWSVRPSVCNARVENWKTSVLDAFFGLGVDGGIMGAWGVDGDWMPLPTHL